MTTTFAAANLQWVGLAPETTYGTPIATPSLFVPADTPTWTPTIENLLDQNLRGTMATDYQQGKGLRYDTVTFKTNVYLDQAFFFFRAILGLPDVVTGEAAPYTHKTSLQSGANGQPQSTTVFFYDADGKAWQMPGAQMSDLKVTFATGALVTLEATFIGLPALPITPPTNTPTVQPPMPSWNTTISIGGTELTQYSEIDLDIARASQMIPTITGTQSPFAIFAGPVTVTGSVTAIYQGSTDLNLQADLVNNQPAMLLTVAPVGDDVHSLALQMSVVAYDDAAVSGTNTWMEVKSNIRALTNPTDVAGSGGMSPMLATLINAVETAI